PPGEPPPLPQPELGGVAPGMARAVGRRRHPLRAADRAALQSLRRLPHHRGILSRRPGWRRVPGGRVAQVGRALLLPRRGTDLSAPPDPLRPATRRLRAPPGADPRRPVARRRLFLREAPHPAERRDGEQDPEAALSRATRGAES